MSNYMSFAVSEIASDEIAAKNWPRMQRADILNRASHFAASSLRRLVNRRLPLQKQTIFQL